MKVLVLGGGDSPEREVSLRSAKAVADAAREAGFEVEEKDPTNGLSFLDDLPPKTIISPILHGAGGEDGSIQAELEKRNLPFLGSDSSSSTNCFDKWKTLEILRAAGLPTAQSELVDLGSYQKSQLANQPHVLKVARGGSSIGTLIVREPNKVETRQVEDIFKLDKYAVLERLVEGTELTVPILDSSALTPIEIIPPEGAEFDYENKYNGMTSEICPPQSVSQAVQEHSKKLAEQVHQAMKCRHLSRVDIMVDKNANLYVLEINTIPGLTSQSLYPKSAKYDGYPMPKLIRRFVEMVVRDYNL